MRVRLPKLRFTVRTLIIAVAVAGLPLSLWARSERLRRVAAHHEKLTYVGATRTPAIVDGGKVVIADLPTKRGWWHFEMKTKYERAARQPWLPVAPDPPPPD